MSTYVTKEIALEDAIENYLITNGGYSKGSNEDFDKEICIDTKTLFSFIKETQPQEWEKSNTIHGKEIEPKLLSRLSKEIEIRGMLDVLRNGITDLGVRYKLVYFKPSSKLNAESIRLYNSNKLTITRQFKYSLSNNNSIDLLLCVNGLPVATAELKNQYTHQTVNEAKVQYITSRDNRELLFQFNKRALVHFAVDTDEVYMTTKIDGDNTRYLPFNKGANNGAGNPPNPNGYKSSYLWEYVWTKDSWLDIIKRFLNLQKEEVTIDEKKFKKEKLIFPRFHQLDCVRTLTDDALKNGCGKNYLIQHSAGSGKSNSIAWLSYHLSNLHDANNERVFNSVIVVTDRKVLDQQLQDTIYQYEHVAGVVQRIDKDSSQLASALESGSNIIITTIQKFPFVLDKINVLPSRKYALIVDEAHSSQSGEASKKMKEVLSAPSLESAVKEDSLIYGDDLTSEDEIRNSMLTRGPQNNLSFFAFTATPKAKTLEVFGQKDPVTGKPFPFHLYSMRQAIEEGFILDVLKNYTTYKTFYRLSKEIEADPVINKKKAKRAIARFLSLHPHNLAQKAEVIIEHFRQRTIWKIGGQAKAMVVTPSRLHVVKYKQEFDKYIKLKKYDDVKAIVAFSGTVKDEYDILYTEADMNNFGEKELPEKFNTTDYNILLVADKYQTGFDQPLLHTMYIDKKLHGVKAVQTLSRLNRTYPGKDDTFILDFANSTEEILESFQPFYETTTVTEISDPNQLYDMKHKIDEYQIILNSEVNAFSEIFFKNKTKHNVHDQSRLNSFIDPAIDRFKNLKDDEQREECKHLLMSFIRLYSFLAQIMPFSDIDLEKFYAYVRLLITKLPQRDLSGRFKLHDEVALDYYRLQKISEGNIILEKDKIGEVKGPVDVGTKDTKEELAPLSEIIQILNDRFGTDFKQADKLFFDSIEEELVTIDLLKLQAQNNSIDNFKFGFNDQFDQKLIDRMDQNQDIFNRIVDDKRFAEVVKKYMLEKVYKRLTS